jgi:ubiquinone biosynthesis protein
LYLFLIKFYWDKLRKRGDATTRAVAARKLLESMGGLWIKAGQLLSLRTDVLSREMADELSNLTYQTTGFDPALARSVVERSLGRPLEAVFDDWEEMPFAAASISQVHRARLRKNGQWVAVKVQRPGIQEVFARDLGLISGILRRMHFLPGLKFINWDGMVRELERIMGEEIDYRYEAANLRRMRKLLRKHKVYVPKPYRPLCSQHIIVMEFVPGVLMTDYLTINRRDPERVQAWCQTNNIEPRKVGSRLMRSFYRQLFEDNLFHGDLHPGNIMLLRDSRFALIDLGTVGSLEARFVRTYRNVVRSFAEGDYTKAVEYYVTLADSVPPIDLSAYRVEMVEILREWEARSHLDGLSFYERSFTGGAATALSEVARKYQINPSWQLLRVARSLNTMDANCSVLLGTANPRSITRKYFKQAAARSIENLRKNGLRRAISSISTISDNASILSDSIRRQAIVFQSAQSKLSYFMGIVINVVRLTLVVVGVVLLYKFLHYYHFALVAPIHNPNSWFGQMVAQLPMVEYALAVGTLLGIASLIYFSGRLHKRLSAPTVRLPDGRLDKA